MLFKADALRRVGYFDESLGGYEADDMCARMRGAGLRMAVANRAYVFHRGRTTMLAHTNVDWYGIGQTAAIRFRSKWNVEREENKAKRIQRETARASLPSYMVKAKAPTYSPRSNVVPVRSSRPRPHVDVVIITHNRLDMTKPCVESIMRHTSKYRYRFVCVDNASTDGTAEYLEGVPNATVIRNEHNVGVPKARNQGIRASTAPYLVVMDNDIEVKNGWLDDLFAEVDKGASMVGIEAWRLDKNWAACAKCTSPSEAFDYLGGACTLFDRKVFEVAGLLDEGYSPAYYEDSLSGDRFVPVRINGEISLLALEKLFSLGRVLAREDGKEESMLTGVETLSVDPDNPCPSLDPDNLPEWWVARFLSDNERRHWRLSTNGVITREFVDNVRPRIKKRLARHYREDAAASWKPLRKVIRHKVNKEMFQVDSRYGQTRCTGDHSLMVWDGPRLKESTPGDLIGRRPCSVSLKIEAETSDHCSLPFNGTWAADGFIPKNKYDRHSVKPFRLPLREGQPGLDYSDPRAPFFFRLMGYYASEGSRHNNAVSFSVYDKSLARRIEESARNSFGRPFKIHEYKNSDKPRAIRGRTFRPKKTTCYNVSFCNKNIADLMENLCGKGARNKMVPSFVYNAPDHLKREFIRALMEGDGHLFDTSSLHSLAYSKEYKEKAFKFSSISLGLASGTCLLLSTLGDRFSVGYDWAKKSYAVNYVQFRKNLRPPNVKVRSVGATNEYVYDLCVDDTHTFVDAMGMLVVHNTEVSIRAKEHGFHLAFKPTGAVVHKQHATLVHGQKTFSYQNALSASYHRFARRMRGELDVKYEKLPPSTRKLRILYLGMRWDYGDRNRGTSYENDNFHPALMQWGRTQELRHFDFVELGKTYGVPHMSDMLVKEAQDFQPDVVFSVFFDEHHDPRKEAFSAIKQACHAVTMNWFCDSHFRYESFDSKWAPYLDFCVTTASSAQKKYVRDGFGGKVIKSQWFASPNYRRIDGVEKDVPVSFIGQPHGDRRAVIDRLRSAGIKVEVFGTGWGRRLSFEEMIMMFNRTKVNLNLNNAADARYKQIKGRNFEVPACGGFLLTGAPDNLAEYYEPGMEVAVFGDAADMIEKVRYYLKNESERERVANAGYERTMREHTSAHRLDAIFSAAGLL